MTILHHHVFDVICIRPKKEMFGVYAAGIIARVTDVKSPWVAFVDFERDAVRQMRAALESYLSISTLVL